MSENQGINMLTTVQCPSCKQHGEWSRTHGRDNRCVVMRCRKCERAIGEELYEHLDKLQTANRMAGFTAEEKKCNKLMVQALNVYRNLRPVDSDGLSACHRAVDEVRAALAHRAAQRELPWKIRQ